MKIENKNNFWIPSLFTDILNKAPKKKREKVIKEVNKTLQKLENATKI